MIRPSLLFACLASSWLCHTAPAADLLRRASARRPQVVNGVTMWDQMRFGNVMALDGTRLVVQDEEIIGDVATTTLRFIACAIAPGSRME